MRRHSEDTVVEYNIKDAQFAGLEGFKDIVGGVLPFLELGCNSAQHFAEDVVEKTEGQLALEVDLGVFPIAEDLADEQIFPEVLLESADIGEFLGFPFSEDI